MTTPPFHPARTLIAGAILALAPLALAAQQSLPDGNYIGTPQRTQIYDAVGTLRTLSNVTLPLDVKQVYDTDFGTTTYFGAFAISKDFGYGYSTGANTLAAAQAIAMSNCLSVNDRCRIIAEIVPQGFSRAEPGVITMSNEIAEYFLNATSYATFRAMAISADGAYSMNWGHPTQQAAEAAALADCETYRNTDNPDITPMPCVIVPDLP